MTLLGGAGGWPLTAHAQQPIFSCTETDAAAVINLNPNGVFFFS
jgi:hypothetical protein